MGPVVVLLLLTTPAPAPGAETPVNADAVSMPADEEALLAEWFKRAAARRPGESFGDLVVRVAGLQLGKAYYDPPQTAGPERLQIELKTFQCVSFVEDSLAVARCLWRGEPTAACFLHDVVASRYRDGRMDGYASRLHYFTDWIEDNARRGRLQIVTGAVGGRALRQRFSFMSDNPASYPALAAPAVLNAIKEIEARLSATPHVVLDRADVARAQSQLENGDVIGLVSDKHPGMVVIHTGFIYVDKHGKRSLMHAASFHKRTLVTGSDVANYLLRRPERRGLMIGRPLPP
ncbi:MAG: DUF1460 domain-containing protein [Deltaproteobacteria bacterium]|nr:DUF1460 domain-containing protein [Deltaproteobacteria bacterium]